MLSLVLRFGDDTEALRRALPGLIGLATESRPLLFIDHGFQNAGREMVQAFIRRHGGGLAALEGPVSDADASAFARQQTGADYVLLITPRDRVNRAGLASLEERLNETSANRVLMACGFWVSSADHPVTVSDILGEQPDLYSGFADPRRLLLQGRDIEHPDPLRDPAEAWTLWDRERKDVQDVLIHPDPVILRPMPEAGAAPSLTAATRLVSKAPRADRRDRLAGILPRLDVALALAPAAAAPATLSAAAELSSALPWTLRRKLRHHSGPAATLLTAMSQGDQSAALAQLGLLAQTRCELCSSALAAEYTALRHDLDLALPGPEYLMDLYTRLRGA